MVELTFTTKLTDHEITVSGQVMTDSSDRLVMHTFEDEYDYRINETGTVALLYNGDIVERTIGVDPQLSGYCRRHNVAVASLTGYDHCPRCREEDRVQSLEADKAVQQIGVDDPAPPESYRR
jgi:hypothetical protein